MNQSQKMIFQTVIAVYKRVLENKSRSKYWALAAALKSRQRQTNCDNNAPEIIVMGMFFKDSPVAIVKCEKCCKRNIQILFLSSPNQLRDYFALPWKQCAKYEKKIGKKTQKCVVCEN